MPVTGAVGDPEVVLALGRELGPPLMYLAPPGGLAHTGLSLEDLYGAGYRIVTDAMSLHLLVFELLRAGYRELAESGFSIGADRAAADWWALVGELNAILAHMDVLSSVDTTDVDAAAIGERAAPLREDGGPQIPLMRPREDVAPRMADGFFLVPRLSTHEDPETA